jgi:integrase
MLCRLLCVNLFGLSDLNMAKQRPRFSGSIYQRGPIWQLQYFVEGRRVRESAKTASKDEAAKLLKKRIAEAREAKPAKPTTVAALGEVYLEAKKARWKPKTYDWAVTIWNNHIKPVFGDRNPADIMPGELDLFVSKLKAEGLSEPYINRNLVIFQAILRYGVKNKALRELPEFPDHFDERPYIRQGYLTQWDFITFIQFIPDDELWLEALVTMAFVFGYRRGELVYMRVGQVDFARNRITLPVGSTKNKMRRVTVFNPKGQIGKLLRSMAKGKRPEQYLFSRDDGSTPARDFRVSFDRAASAAKIATGSGPGGKLWFHDLRRSAVTHMDDIGLSESQSMSIAGHLTPDIHRRYKILSENKARQLAEKLDPDV